MQNKKDCERKKAIEELIPVLKTMEEFLSNTEYFACNEMTIADISMFPTVTTVYVSTDRGCAASVQKIYSNSQ